MNVHEVMNHARDAMTVKRVFGDPYEKDGVTVIPVANVMGGAGAGGGEGAGPSGGAGDAGAAGSDAPVAGSPSPSGYGMGYGLRATPAGVYVVKGGEVEWKPALDVNRLTMQRAITLIVGLLVVRSVIRTLAKR
jgi:uncharacterized spore protein YtfJ